MSKRDAVTEYLDRVVDAYLALYPSRTPSARERAKRSLGHDVEPLVRELNPNYPGDTLDPALALMTLAHRTDQFRLPRVEDVTVIRDMLPDCCREVRVEISTAGIKISGNWGKHSSVYWTACYKDLGYPFELTVTRYADMDLIENHSDYCPMRLPEGDPEWSDDCCCEAEVEVFETLKITEKEDGEDVLDTVRDFLRKHLEV